MELQTGKLYPVHTMKAATVKPTGMAVAVGRHALRVRPLLAVGRGFKTWLLAALHRTAATTSASTISLPGRQKIKNKTTWPAPLESCRESAVKRRRLLPRASRSMLAMALAASCQVHSAREGSAFVWCLTSSFLLSGELKCTYTNCQSGSLGKVTTLVRT